jgi:hypothetical protein
MQHIVFKFRQGTVIDRAWDDIADALGFRIEHDAKPLFAEDEDPNLALIYEIRSSIKKTLPADLLQGLRKCPAIEYAHLSSERHMRS